MRFSLLLFALGLVLPSLRAQDDYKPGPDSLPQTGVPKGEMLKGTYTAKEGSVFPGTEREYQIYLPAGLDKSKPAPFMVFQDGMIYNAPTVFDNLIAKKEIPPLIGIFIKPGVVPAANPNALPRFNRSYEYDSVSDTYSRFLIEEFLPAIQQKHGLNLSTDPNDAATSGISSGGICAFMTAWHRPDRFRRVFTGVGTYVGIHGADQLPVLVRKIEPKPLRIYLQSGTGDNNLYCGDWWMANQMMERSLSWAGYDVNHAWGEGGHNAKHATQIFPDVLRWLWRDYATAKEIKPNPRGESKWVGYQVIGDGKWGVAAQGLEDAMHLASSIDGRVYAADNTHGQIWTIVANSDPKKIIKLGDHIGGLALASDNEIKISSTREAPHIRSIDLDGKTTKIHKADLHHPEGICVSNKGNAYIASSLGPKIIEVDLLNGAASRQREWKLHDLDSYPNGLALSPDQSFLYATLRDRFVTSWQILEDGSLAHCQPYFELEVSDQCECASCGLCVDTNGWLYVTTSLGIQVLDQAGRVNFIIPTPQQPHDVCFGGKDLGELFIACGDKIYKRQTKAHGIVSGQMAPIKPPAPKL